MVGSRPDTKWSGFWMVFRHLWTQTIWILDTKKSGIQMNLVFGCPVFGWLLYLVIIRRKRKSQSQTLNSSFFLNLKNFKKTLNFLNSLQILALEWRMHNFKSKFSCQRWQQTYLSCEIVNVIFYKLNMFYWINTSVRFAADPVSAGRCLRRWGKKNFISLKRFQAFCCMVL